MMNRLERVGPTLFGSLVALVRPTSSNGPCNGPACAAIGEMTVIHHPFGCIPIEICGFSLIGFEGHLPLLAETPPVTLVHQAGLAQSNGTAALYDGPRADLNWPG